MMTCSRLLDSVQKPYQYVGHEENAYNKSFDEAAFRFCLAFPDAYEIGMSNVGMQIIYHILNEIDEFMCDRVYAPLTDMGDLMLREGERLTARESRRHLAEFDCIGFTLQYELAYTNVLYMLDLAGIPLLAKDRSEDAPFVIAGGPCVFNPEPVADFFDFFVIGEGEDVVVEVCDVLADAKRRALTRKETLLAVSRVQGVYVPSHYTPRYDDAQRFVKLERGEHAPKWVERRIVKDLDQISYPIKPVTPAIRPIHERISVEIQRGCTRSCRFCQAGYIYRPRRERSPQKIVDIIEASVRATGTQDIGLLSLSSADYSHIHPLMKAIMERYKKEHLSVSLPSTRLEALKEEYLDVLKEERRAGFTIAPEAGSQRLRNVINKNFTEEEIVETARMLFRNGWHSVKMYFMIGQPTETDDDVIAIAELGNTVFRKTQDIPGRKTITISVSNFVPKPHTPFQWHEQISHAEIKRKQRLIRDHIRYKAITFRSHDADSSYAEGLVARADRRFARLLLRVYEKGARFDCWQDKFDLKVWQDAVAELKEETGHDFATEGLRGRALEERLPWHRVYSGLHPKFFKNEYMKAIYGVATEDCSFAACHECGLCNEKSGVAPIVYTSGTMPIAKGEVKEDAAPAGPPQGMRFQYSKLEEGIYISTLDLQKIFLRAFARAGLYLAYDNGMRPRPKLTMGPALPLGVASRCELFDVVLLTSLTPDEVVQRVNPYLPTHLQILTGAKLEARDPGITGTIRGLSYSIELEALTSLAPERDILSNLAALQAADKFIVQRERKARNGTPKRSVIDLKDSVEALHQQGRRLQFTMAAPNGQSTSPFLVIEALIGQELGNRMVPLTKTGFHASTL